MKTNNFLVPMQKTYILLAMVLGLCSIQASCDPEPIEKENVNPENGKDEISSQFEAIDLGLSVKWASCNLGANSPEEYGDYYAWGETQTKSDYSWETYKWCNGDEYSMTKYCTESDYGKVDNRTTLTKSDDVASVILGNGWRIPTADEFYELFTECSWKLTMHKGVKGVRFTGSNGKSIFLPAAGYQYDSETYKRGLFGRYWSASLSDYSGGCDAWYFAFDESKILDYQFIYRYCGHTIRPVNPTLNNNEAEKEQEEEKNDDEEENNDSDDENNQTTGTVQGHAYVDLGLSVKWATCNVGASKPEDYGDYYAWGETTTKSDYSWETYKWCNGDEYSLTKYCDNSRYGLVDNCTKLTSWDDVATVKWGSEWRMPTKEELMELKEKCLWTWITQGDNAGYKITGLNGCSIFLPAAGRRDGQASFYSGINGEYWGATQTIIDYSAFYLYLKFYIDQTHYLRYYGRSVRPVTE